MTPGFGGKLDPRVSFTRAVVAALVARYFEARETGWWARQSQVTRFVQENAPVTIDREAVWRFLRELAEQGFLERVEEPPRAVSYRVDPKHLDPTHVGSTRLVDEHLDEPVWWVTHFGVFQRRGRPGRPFHHVHDVPSQPTHLERFAWMRAWIRAFTLGLFEDQPGDALRIVDEAARAAPVDALWHYWVTRPRQGASPGRAFEETRLFRRTYARWSTWAQKERHQLVPAQPPWAPSEREAREGFAVLRALCGRRALPGWDVRGELPSKWRNRRLLTDLEGFLALDMAIMRRVWSCLKPRAAVDAPPGPASSSPMRERIARGPGVLFYLLPSFGPVEPFLRALPPETLETMVGGGA